MHPSLTGDHHLPPCPHLPSSLLPLRAPLLRSVVLLSPCSPAAFASAHCARLSSSVSSMVTAVTRDPHPARDVCNFLRLPPHVRSPTLFQPSFLRLALAIRGS
jgi:hypothetical protein